LANQTPSKQPEKAIQMSQNHHPLARKTNHQEKSKIIAKKNPRSSPRKIQDHLQTMIPLVQIFHTFKQTKSIQQIKESMVKGYDS